jgi:hypothetical protein
MTRKLHPTTRRIARRDPNLTVVTDRHGGQHVVAKDAAPGSKAQRIAQAVGVSQLKQAHERGQPYQRPDDRDIEERIKARQRQEAEVQRDARRKMFNLD